MLLVAPPRGDRRFSCDGNERNSERGPDVLLLFQPEMMLVVLCLFVAGRPVDRNS